MQQQQNNSGMNTGEDDLKQFLSKLKNKDLELYNANSLLQTYLSKRGNVETVVGEEYEKAGELKSEVESHIQNSEYYQQGWVKREVFEKSQERSNRLESILQWRELEVQVQDVFIRKQNELITTMKGQDMSREILDEVKEVFSERYDRQDEQLDKIENFLDDRLDTVRDNLEKRIELIEQRERQSLRFAVDNLNTLAEMIDAFNEMTDAQIEQATLPDQLAKRLKELDMADETPDSAMPDNIEEEPEPTPDVTDTSVEEDDTPPDVDPKEQTDLDVEMDDAEETYPDREVVKEGGFTDRKQDIKGDLSETDWGILEALDKGMTEKGEIRDYIDTELMALPMQAINRMLKRGQIDKMNLPENLREDAKN